MVGEPVQFGMHQREQLPQRSLVSAAPLAEQLGDRLLRGSGRRHEGFSPPQIVSRSRDFYSTTGGNRKKLRSRGGFEAVSPLSHMNRQKNKDARITKNKKTKP
jgi:hypothetical protein